MFYNGWERRTESVKKTSLVLVCGVSRLWSRQRVKKETPFCVGSNKPVGEISSAVILPACCVHHRWVRVSVSSCRSVCGFGWQAHLGSPRESSTVSTCASQFTRAQRGLWNVLTFPPSHSGVTYVIP